MQLRPRTIFRIIKGRDNPYVMVDRRPIDNPALSFKAKGVLTYLLSRPDDWEVNITDLCRHSTDGAAAIRAALHELMRAGHVRYNTQRKNSGKFQKWVIEVYERPLPADTPLDENRDVAPPQPLCDYPQVEKPQMENRTQVINDLTNTEVTNMGAVAPATREKRITDPIEWEQRKEEMAAKREAEAGRSVALDDRINGYPEDCRSTLIWFVSRFNIPTAAVPVKPKGKGRGSFAQWINEIRHINALLESTGTTGLEAAARASDKLSISHPGALAWCLPAEVGKILKRRQSADREPELPPLQAELRAERLARQAQPA